MAAAERVNKKRRSLLLDLIYPPKCLFCRRILSRGESGICGSCREKLPAEPQERTGDFFRVCVAPLPYAGGYRDAVLRYKFNGKSFYAPFFGELLAQTVRKELDGTFDLITWVPVSKKRLRSRGYDQTRLLAEQTAKQLGLEAAPLLTKIRHNPAQSGIRDAAARKSNVLNAYRVDCPERVSDKRILIIDDIITTGATLSECCRMLETAGAKRTVAAALAAAEKK